VNLNDDVAAAFLLLWRFCEGKGNVFAHLYNSSKTIAARGWFKVALTDAGITDFHWHDLRHTFASRLVMAGVHPYGSGVDGGPRPFESPCDMLV
jgi:integrase